MAIHIDKELAHKPLKDEVHEMLNRQIMAGKYKPGDWLRQEDIALEMGVSMTPVREALDLLVSSGLAERVPYRGVRVRQMSVQDMVDAYGLRLLLESLAVREAARNITPEQVNRLEGILAAIQKHVKPHEMLQERRLSSEFHTVLVEASGNALLIKLYAIIANSFPDWLLYEAVFNNPQALAESISQTCSELGAVLEALKRGDAGQAVQKEMEHVLDAGRWMEKYLDIPAELLREKEEDAKFMIQKPK